VFAVVVAGAVNMVVDGVAMVAGVDVVYVGDVSVVVVVVVTIVVG